MRGFNIFWQFSHTPTHDELYGWVALVTVHTPRNRFLLMVYAEWHTKGCQALIVKELAFMPFDIHGYDLMGNYSLASSDYLGTGESYSHKWIL